MLTHEELQTFRDAIGVETVIRIRARVSEDNVFGSPEALLEELIDRDASDVGLHEHLVELQKPVTHEDDVFGTFTLNRRANWYAAEVVWNGTAVRLRLSATEPSELEPTLETARALWGEQVEWNDRIRDFAVEKLLALKNNNWLDEDEAELSADDFKGKMTLKSVTVCSDGEFEFWHDDGDLFCGHAIQICGNLSNGLTDADIPG